MSQAEVPLTDSGPPFDVPRHVAIIMDGNGRWAAARGLPRTEGQVLRLRIPELNEERRKELVKVAHKYAEAARVAVRHVRRDGLDVLKKLEKDHKISEDDGKRSSEQVQKATDEAIAEVDRMLAGKEKEILTV